MPMRKRYFVKALAGALLMALALLSMPGIPQQTYNFSYRWKAGDRFAYSMYVIGQVTTGESSNQQVKIQFTDVWEVLEEDKLKGLFKVAERNQEFSGTEFDLRSFGIPAKDERIERMIDGYGRVASVAHYTEGNRYYLFLLVFPQSPVAAGGRWKLAQKLRVPLLEREVVTDAVILYTVEDINKDYKGRKNNYARIRVDANYKYEPAGGAEGVIGAFQGKIILDTDKMRIIDYQISENRKEWVRSENRSRTTNIQITAIAQM